MKRLILILSIISALYIEGFGYFKSQNMIDFLVHSNQLQIRTDRFGVLAGTRNWRFAVGLTDADRISGGIILHNTGEPASQDANNKGIDKFVPSVSAAFGYDSDLFGIGVGYEFTWKSPTYMVHTPSITATALNDNFKINIPISIGVGGTSYIKSVLAGKDDLEGTIVVSTAIEGQYYFQNQPYLGHLTFFFNYGNAYIEAIDKPNASFTQQSIGGEFRMYFKVDTPNVIIEPIIRVRFDTALKTTYKGLRASDLYDVFDSFDVSAKGFNPSQETGSGAASTSTSGASAIGTLSGGYIASIPDEYYAKEPYRIGIAFPVGFRASSDDGKMIFYFEPALSLTVINAKDIYQKGYENYPEDSRLHYRRNNPFYTFGYVVYGELTLRPVPQLEWYTEIQTGGATVAGNLASTGVSTKFVLNGKTGISWYF
ncbi:cell surface protein [uncultured Brachyspira sp.]|uniref:cell surface protein n=1 Tax=uncultured Brachyspira sp. TaxID=221953 RepID=UPI0025CC2BE8|nr:cell surface protein [uncultured Brachyspira sp.]